MYSVADPDIELGGGPGFDLLTLLLSPFCHFFFFYEKLGGGAAPRAPPLNPPLVFETKIS